MIISFGGAHGSGKSTIAKKIAEKLSWPRYYMGGLRREAAQKRGMTLEEYRSHFSIWAVMKVRLPLHGFLICHLHRFWTMCELCSPHRLLC